MGEVVGRRLGRGGEKVTARKSEEERLGKLEEGVGGGGQERNGELGEGVKGGDRATNGEGRMPRRKKGKGGESMRGGGGE